MSQDSTPLYPGGVSEDPPAPPESGGAQHMRELADRANAKITARMDAEESAFLRVESADGTPLTGPAPTSGSFTAEDFRRAFTHVYPPATVPLPPILLDDARAARDILDAAGLLPMLDATIEHAEQTAVRAVEAARDVVAMHHAALEHAADLFGIPRHILVSPSAAVTDRRKLILTSAEDAGTDFVGDDRSEDEDLGPGEVEAAVKAGEISHDDIVAAFRRGLEIGARW